MWGYLWESAIDASVKRPLEGAAGNTRVNLSTDRTHAKHYPEVNYTFTRNCALLYCILQQAADIKAPIKGLIGDNYIRVDKQGKEVIFGINLRSHWLRWGHLRGLTLKSSHSQGV